MVISWLLKPTPDNASLFNSMPAYLTAYVTLCNSMSAGLTACLESF